MKSFLPIGLLLAFTVLSLFSCQSADQKESNGSDSEVVALSPTDSVKAKLRAEVMEIHDDAMAKMSKLYDLEISLKNAVDSTSAEDMKLVAERIMLLQKANNEMMSWMKQYKDPKEEKNLEEIKSFFTTQLTSISAVKVLTDSSIMLAEERLEKK